MGFIAIYDKIIHFEPLSLLPYLSYKVPWCLNNTNSSSGGGGPYSMWMEGALILYGLKKVLGALIGTGAPNRTNLVLLIHVCCKNGLH